MDLSLEIHHLDTHGGDATAIIVKELGEMELTLCRVLIDAGAEGSGSACLAPYLMAHLGGLDFDCIIATHYHKDHIEGFKQAGVTFKKYMDNGGYSVNGVRVDPINGIGKGVRGSSIFSNYAAHIQQGGSATRVAIPFITDGGKAEPIRIELGVGTGIKLTCFCANGILANGTNVLQAQKKDNNTNKAYSPNDLSLAFLLEWEDFTYFTAGDLSGDKTLSSYYNVEKALLDYLTGETNGPLKGKTITAFKASHHGSEHSNDPALFEKLKPELIITSCNQPKKVPSPVFLGRLKDFVVKNNTATVAFTNSLYVYRNDDRYGKLDDIKTFIAKDNVEFTKTDGEEIASNRGIKAITIRRRTGGAKYTDKLDADLLKIDKGKYEILLRKRKSDDNSLSGNVMKFKTYDLKKHILEYLYAGIVRGFRAQAIQIVQWLIEDERSEESVGIDYVQENFPGLVGAIQNNPLTDSLVFELTDFMDYLFQSSFEIKTIGETMYYAPKDNNSLTSDEKQTLFDLLMNNIYQEEFNTVGKIWNYPDSSAHSWRKDRAWNATGEPYESTEDDRKPKLEPSDGKRKRSKEEE